MNKLTVTVLLAILVGCNSPGPTPTATLPGEGLEWEKIGYATSGQVDPSGDEARVVVATNGQEASLLEGHVGSFYLQKVLDTDFSTYFVIAVFQGYQGGAGCSVKVKEVRQDDDFITVYATFLTPDSGDFRQPIATSPYYVLRIRKTPALRGDFAFVLDANGKEIMRQSHFIP